MNAVIGGWTALAIAAAYGHAEFVEILLQYGANNLDIVCWGATALEHATKKNHVRIMELLSGPVSSLIMDPEEVLMTPLYYAAMRGDVEHVNRLMIFQVNEAWLERTFHDWTPLMVASCLGHVDVVNRLLQFNVHVNARSQYGETALILAAKRGHINVVRALLALTHVHVNIKAETILGSNALQAALHGNHTDIVVLLEQANV